MYSVCLWRSEVTFCLLRSDLSCFCWCSRLRNLLDSVYSDRGHRVYTQEHEGERGYIYGAQGVPGDLAGGGEDHANSSAF